MHPFSILTLGIFIAGYITARWDLVTRLYELAIFAIDHGVVVSEPLAVTEAHQPERTESVMFSMIRPGSLKASQFSPFFSFCSLYRSSVLQLEKRTWYASLVFRGLMAFANINFSILVQLLTASRHESN